jgi:hypothetical protein
MKYELDTYETGAPAISVADPDLVRRGPLWPDAEPDVVDPILILSHEILLH